MAATVPRENQLAAAAEIVDAFLTDGIKYALLIAQMQSGKTGVFQTVIHQLLTGGHVDRVYILCGSNEVELRAQAIQETAAYNPGEARISVVFRQDFAKTPLPPTLERTLFILEESHLDQDVGQQLHTLLQRFGVTLTGAAITPTTYIVSVSATPFSEFSTLIHDCPLKRKVTLTPGAAYRGVGFFWRTGRVRRTYSIAQKARNFRTLVLSKGNSWNIMRVDSANRRQIRDAVGDYADIRYFTQNRRDIRISDLNEPPTRPTIVIIDGLLRCGKVVPKRHIGFVWENAAAPGTDTILQSLLGRMCGYDHGGNYPHIYISPALFERERVSLDGEEKSLNEIERYIEFAENGFDILPLNGRNLCSSKQHPATHALAPVIPLPIPVGELWPAGFDATNAKRFIKNNYTAAQQAVLRAYIEHSDRHTREQKEAMADYVSAALTPRGKPYCRELGERKQQKYMRTLFDSYEAGIAPTDWIRNGGTDNKMTLCYMNETSLRPDHVYVVFQLPLSIVPDVKKLVPVSTETHIFKALIQIAPVIDEEAAQADVAPAGQLILFSADITHSPALFERQLDYMAGLTYQWEIGAVPCAPASAVAGSMNFSKAIYGNDMTSLQAVFARIGARYGYTFDFKRTPAADGFIHLSKITWERATAVAAVADEDPN